MATHYQNVQRAQKIIEGVLREYGKVNLATLTILIRREFGFGSQFVKRTIKDLEAAKLVKVNNCVAIWQDKEGIV